MGPTEVADFLRSPSRWPYRPMLPMKLIRDGALTTGYILEQQGLRIFGHDRSLIEQFSSVEELIAAGWQID